MLARRIRLEPHRKRHFGNHSPWAIEMRAHLPLISTQAVIATVQIVMIGNIYHYIDTTA
jgi:hypothetical protein